jgi:2-methylcitrate dehydratase PrpD
MPTAAQTLAQFAVNLKYDQIPATVRERAKDCVIDTVGVCTFCSSLPESSIIIDYAKRYGKGGTSSIFGTAEKVHAPQAALANGALAHSFEMDCLVQPGVGVHPGASITSPGFATAQEIGASGRDFIAAFVAADEVMHRIGAASHRSTEKIGFHAPGVTGAFGGAAVAGKLLGLNADQMACAFGIAGSMCSGLLEFAKSGGGMVKRLHLGHAAHSGVLAARLAAGGFTGPQTILEGKRGYLSVFCRDGDEKAFTAGLGTVWKLEETLTFKRYACHITSHVPVTAALALKTKHGIKAADIASLALAVTEEVAHHHDIPEPSDVPSAQYSTQFAVALAFCRDPNDPTGFSEAALKDTAIRALARSIKVEFLAEADSKSQLSARIAVRLNDGREFSETLHQYPGMPSQPLSRDELHAKFTSVTANVLGARSDRVFDQLANLDSAKNVALVELV